MNRPIRLKDIDIVIYHKGCQDGINSAFVFKYACKKKKKNIKMIPSLHKGEEIDLEEIQKKNIIMVDIVTDNVDYIRKFSKNFYALDHHISSYEKHKLSDSIYFDMDKCGTTLAYEYVYKDKDPPIFIKCIQARDLWTWDVEKSKEFTTGFYELGNDKNINLYEIFKELMKEENENKNEKFNEIVSLGEIMIEEKNKKIIELFNTIIITNIKIDKRLQKNECKLLNSDLFVTNEETESENKFVTNKKYKIVKLEVDNEDYKIRSDFGNYCMRNLDIDFIVIYKHNEINEEYYCALRSKEGKTNLVKEGIASGHPYAAGLTLNVHPDNYFVNTN